MDEPYRGRDDLLAELEQLKRKISELDVVDAKRELAVAELENQSKVWRKILETMPGGVIVLDAQGQYVLFSPGAEQLFGVGPQEATPVEWLEKFGALLPDGHTPAAMGDMPLFRALQGENVDHAEFIIRNPRDRETRWVSASARPIRGDTGEVRGAVVSLLDITQRKMAERGLRLLISATREIAEAKNLDQALEAVVRNVCEATGWTYGEAWIPVPDGSGLEASRSWYGNHPQVRKFREASRALTIRKGVGLAGRVMETKRPVWIPDLRAQSKAVFARGELAVEMGMRSAAAVPIRTDGDIIAVLTFFSFESRKEDAEWVDQVSHLALQLSGLFERKRAEAALLGARNETAQALELTSATVSGINHVMRQHVAAIIGFSDLIDGTQLTPKQREYLEMIRRSANEQVEILKKEMDNAPKRA